MKLSINIFFDSKTIVNEIRSIKNFRKLWIRFVDSNNFFSKKIQNLFFEKNLKF